MKFILRVWLATSLGQCLLGYWHGEHDYFANHELGNDQNGETGPSLLCTAPGFGIKFHLHGRTKFWASVSNMPPTDNSFSTKNNGSTSRMYENIWMPALNILAR